MHRDDFISGPVAERRQIEAVKTGTRSAPLGVHKACRGSRGFRTTRLRRLPLCYINQNLLQPAGRPWKAVVTAPCSSAPRDHFMNLSSRSEFKIFPPCRGEIGLELARIKAAPGRRKEEKPREPWPPSFSSPGPAAVSPLWCLVEGVFVEVFPRLGDEAPSTTRGGERRPREKENPCTLPTGDYANWPQHRRETLQGRVFATLSRGSASRHPDPSAIRFHLIGGCLAACKRTTASTTRQLLDCSSWFNEI